MGNPTDTKPMDRVVSARLSGTDQEYQFVSYERKRGNRGPIDLGLVTHFHAGHYAMTSKAAEEASGELRERGYDVIVTKYGGPQYAIDLDQMLFDGKLKEMMDAVQSKGE